MIQRECPYSLSMAQSFERLVGAVIYGSDLSNWVKYSGERYFHQGYEGKSDGVLIQDNQIKMKLECKILDCSKKKREAALKTLFSPSYRTYKFLDSYRNDDVPFLRLLVIGIHEEDKMKAWKRLDPSIYSFVVVAYLGEHDGSVQKVVREYDSFDSFSDDIWEASDEREYFEKLNGSNEIKKHLNLYDRGNFEILQTRIFKRLTELHPRWIYERLSLDAMIEEQFKAGKSASITNKRAILESRGIKSGRNLTAHFEGIQWIVSNEKTGRNKEYYVQIKKIIKDIWDEGHEAKTKAFVDKFGLPH